MALYEEFTFKSNGAALTSMDDFIGATTGTQFEKNTGELYTKTANGVFDKVTRKYFSQIESDAKYVDAAGDTFTGTMMPNANNTLMIGSDTVRFNTIFATTFNGKATDSALLNGYGDSTSSTANSIARRDASGNLTAGTFNGTSTNSALLNGYGESTTAAANSIARRDASGNLTAGTFNGTSTNSSQLNGYTQSVYATANTIALRDAYGNLNAVLFQGTATTAR